jgi:hypothetical protein
VSERAEGGVHVILNHESAYSHQNKFIVSLMWSIFNAAMLYVSNFTPVCCTARFVCYVML